MRQEKQLPTTSGLFEKFFGTMGVGLDHPNIEYFFEALNLVCIEEDKALRTTLREETNQGVKT